MIRHLNGLLLIDNRFALTVAAIGQILNLNNIALSRKARRQNWPYYEDKQGVGSPTHLYPLPTLPDDIQCAWAGWGEKQRLEALKREESKQKKGRVEAVPDAITKEQAAEALSWKSRRVYYQKIPPEPGKKKGRSKVYDGLSSGLCTEARQILSDRFPELIPVTHLPPPESSSGTNNKRGDLSSEVKKNTLYNRSTLWASESAQAERLKHILERKSKIVQETEQMFMDIQAMLDQKDDLIKMQKDTITRQDKIIKDQASEIMRLKNKDYFN